MPQGAGADVTHDDSRRLAWVDQIFTIAMSSAGLYAMSFFELNISKGGGGRADPEEDDADGSGSVSRAGQMSMFSGVDRSFDTRSGPAMRDVEFWVNEKRRARGAPMHNAAGMESLGEPGSGGGLDMDDGDDERSRMEANGAGSLLAPGGLRSDKFGELV